MEVLWSELTYGIPTLDNLGHTLIRLSAAIVLGTVIGYEREKAGKAAGMRTHILVMLGTCVFISPSWAMSWDGTSRIIQGIITGIGFLGAGSILKIGEQPHVRGLTTAAGIWMTAAIGVAVGVGAVGIAIISTILTLIVLHLLKRLEHKVVQEPTAEGKD
jgi:putative Mg2+ transporter-C (MgtC) family protein